MSPVPPAAVAPSPDRHPVAPRRRAGWPARLAVTIGLLVTLAGCAAGNGAPGGLDGGGSGGDAWSLAQKAEGRGDYATAASLYRKVAAERGDGVKAEVALGRSLYRAGQYSQAEEAYNRAIKQAPKTADAHLGLGRALLALDRPQAAIDAFEAGRQFGETDRATGYIGHGVALDMVGRHAEAQRAYEDGLKRAPDNIKLLNNYGLSLALSGDLKAAIEVLEPLTRDGGGTERIRQNLALAYGLNGEPQKAAEVANYDLSPDAVDGNLKYYRVARELVKPDRSTGSRPGRADTTRDTAGGNAFWAQLGAYRSADQAREGWARLQETHADLLGDESLDLQVKEVAGEGTFHRVRIGPFDGRSTPGALCAELKARDQGCVVKPSRPAS